MEDFLSLEVVRSATEVPPAVEGETPEEPEVYEQDLAVTSSHFLLQGEINIGTARLYINSILQRKDGKVKVVSRDFSNQQVDTNKEPEE